MKKEYLYWSDIENQTQEIARQISCSRWQPSYVVGLTRGGLTPATLLSQYFGCSMHTLSVRLRDGGDNDCESNLWMAEDAFGWRDSPENILIVDDINDSGATLNWIVNDWMSGCRPHDEKWNTIWNNNVRFATLYDNLSSDFKFKIDYSAVEINKAENDVWLVFPWEDWWCRKT